MLWETVADQLVENNVTIIFNARVVEVHLENKNVQSVTYHLGNKEHIQEADAVFSTMPLKNLLSSIKGENQPNKKILDVALGLEYRDFLIVGLLVKRVKFQKENNADVTDNWLYIQDGGVKVGRLQLFNNWSPFMVNGNDYWIGAEYFCSHKDAIWNYSDEELKHFALKELTQIGIITAEDFIDGTVVRVPKAYPSYTGTFNQLPEVETYLDSIENIYPIGRNGMHKYNNQDHSMLTAFKAVELFNDPKSGNKSELWALNSEDEYQEEVKVD
jgi:protoporphyrinogen oxidase